MVKYVSLFRKTIRMAIKNGWLDKDPFANYEGRLRVVDREYLSKDELEILMHKPISHERIETVRDIFVFACYTGLAYVDVAKLKEEHLVRDVEGNYWIRINRTKTDTASMIPILPQAWRLSRNMPTAQIGKSKKYYYLFVPTKKPMPTSRRLLTFVGLPKP